MGKPAEGTVVHLKNSIEEELEYNATVSKTEIVQRVGQDQRYVSEFDREMEKYLKGGKADG
jgi:hypothetical protein